MDLSASARTAPRKFGQWSPELNFFDPHQDYLLPARQANLTAVVNTAKHPGIVTRRVNSKVEVQDHI